MKKGIVLALLLALTALAVAYSISNAPRHQKPVVAGFAAPDFQLADYDGGTWRLSGLDGVVFINFWATWCKECRQEMPSIQRLYEKKKDDPKFHLLSILYQDDPAKAREFMDKNKYTFPVLVDPGGKTAYSYGLTGVPETYIINHEGMVKKKTLGPAEWDSTVVMNELSAILAEAEVK
jgi:cytochrome c biogenesis protein CcmG/thiol:disulfide interchange protein DsbE